jgi:hypothetical protein
VDAQRAITRLLRARVPSPPRPGTAAGPPAGGRPGGDPPLDMLNARR